MEVGLGVGGLYDCSGVFADIWRLIYGQDRGTWPSELRHTRQMVPALEAAGEVERPLELATPRDIGKLVFSRVLNPEPTLPVEIYGPAPPRIIHVSTLDGFTSDGQPLVIEAAGKDGRVLRRVPPEPERPLERFMLSSSVLARLAMEAAEQNMLEQAALVAV